MRDRALSLTVLVLLVVTFTGHAVGAFLATGSAWGVHFYAFLPTWFFALSSLTLVGVSILSRRAGFVAFLDRATAIAARRQSLAMALLMPASGLLFWLARVRHTMLGDGNTILSVLPEGTAFHIRSPLTGFLHYHAFHAMKSLMPEGTPNTDAVLTSMGLVSVLAGVAFVPVALGLAREIHALLPQPKQPAHRSEVVVWFLAAVLLSQGYMLLFFGYVEHYTYYLVALAGYLWLALRFLRRRVAFLLPAAAAVLAIGLHLSAAIVLPSLALLAGFGLVQRETRSAVLRDCGVIVVVIATLAWFLSRLEEGYNLFGYLMDVTKLAVVGGGTDFAYMFSTAHLRDFFNEQLLVGPLGLLLFLPALVVQLWSRGWRSQAGTFLAVVGITYLGASWVAGDSNLGYARNWDLLAPGGLVFCAAGLGLLLRFGTAARAVPPTLVVALAISLYHTVPWIAVNASSERSIERTAQLPLGRGKAETTVANWYLYQGNRPKAVAWLKRAIAIYPNNNAYSLLGFVYMEEGSMDLAAEAFGQAARRRPDKVGYRHNLAKALSGAQRYEESLPHWRWLCEQDPSKVEYWMEWSLALQNLQRGAEARQVLERAVPVFTEQVRREPGSFQANVGLGTVLAGLERPEEALVYFQRALQVDPDSAVVLYIAGGVLMRLNRGDEARSYLQRLLSLQPNHPRRGQIESWLRQIDAH